MKIVEKTTLIIFSYLILILAVILCLLIFGWVELDFVHDVMATVLNNPGITTTVLIASVICILLSIKCIFFDSTSKEIAKQREGILLENDEGKLLISKETLESLIASVAKGFNGAENVRSKVYVDKENNLSVYITLFVHQDAVIKDLSLNLQSKIKEAIKKTSDLDVKEVNIRVVNITPENKAIEE
mgnify:CR=1 FL=1